MREMTVQKVCLDGVEVEASTRFIHERRYARGRIVPAALIDPLDRFFQTDFQLDVHSGPRPAAGCPPVTALSSIGSIVGRFRPDKVTGIYPGPCPVWAPVLTWMV